MRRANKTGSIVKLSGKRRKPYTVRVTDGYTDEGKQIKRYIGYFETKREASACLEAYLIKPTKDRHMTLKEAWEGWSESFTGSPNTVASYKASFNKMRKLWDLNLDDLDLNMMQKVADTEPKTHATVQGIKKTFSALLEYGFAHDACPASRKALLQYLVVPKSETVQKARRFTDDEIQLAIDSECILAVVLLFTGLRRGELLSLEEQDIDLENQVIHVRKSKTQAGIRDVPIPNRLVPWVKKWKEIGLGISRRVMESRFWAPYPIHDHRRHDCRHTYISILTEQGIDERLIKALVGHTGGVTTDVYTHFTDDVKLEAVNDAFNLYLPIIVNGDAKYDRILA